ncbi:MAG: hypothetical protein NOU37_04700 [Candidatus Brocadiales bacterium]|nr:hypothetical protein [Candidatus Bathyanammoxibius amoris]
MQFAQMYVANYSTDFINILTFIFEHLWVFTWGIIPITIFVVVLKAYKESEEIEKKSQKTQLNITKQEYIKRIENILNALLKCLKAFDTPIERGRLLPAAIKGKKQIDKIYRELKKNSSFVFKLPREHPSVGEARQNLKDAIEQANASAKQNNLPIKYFVSPIGPLLHIDDLANWCTLQVEEWGYPTPKERLDGFLKANVEHYERFWLFSGNAYDRLENHIPVYLKKQFERIRQEINDYEATNS